MGVHRILRLLLFSLASLLIVAGCSEIGNRDNEDEEPDAIAAATSGEDETNDTESPAAVPVDRDHPIEIGVVLSLSGPNAVYGDPTRAGIELALDDFANADDSNDMVFTATFLDDEGDPEVGAAQFREHSEQGVMALLGPTLSNTAFDAHPVAQEAGVPVLAVSNTAAGITDIGDFIFRVSLAESAVVPQTVELITNAWHPETAALIYSEDDAWSRSSADAFREAAAEFGIEIIIEQDLASDGDDFSEQVRAIDEANPDVLLLSTLEAASIGFVSQAREAGLSQYIACGNGCNTGTFISETGTASEGLVVGSAWHIDLDTEESQSFVERYRAHHGQDPDQFSAQGYAGMQVLAAAVSTLDEIDRASLRDALAELGEIETVLGTFSFDENGDGHHPAAINIVQDGTFSIFGK